MQAPPVVRRRLAPVATPMSSPLRAGWQLAASWSVTVVSCALISLVTMVTGGVFTRRLAPWYLRTWGRTMLRIAGVEVVVEGHAHLATDTMKVATFNHGSMLDAFIIASLMPRGGVGAIKIQVLCSKRAWKKRRYFGS
jgi:1-acyl-sn-glycerol-3-phosphate acyltransferase